MPLSRAIVWGRQAPVELLLEAKRYREGLLVMGASSRPPQLGATTAPVVRACPCSVLIVRRGGASADAAGDAEGGNAAGTAVALQEDADGERGP